MARLKWVDDAVRCRTVLGASSNRPRSSGSSPMDWMPLAGAPARRGLQGQLQPRGGGGGVWVGGPLHHAARSPAAHDQVPRPTTFSPSFQPLPCPPTPFRAAHCNQPLLTSSTLHERLTNEEVAPHAASLARLLLRRFEPSEPLPDTPFEVALAELTAAVDDARARIRGIVEPVLSSESSHLAVECAHR